MILLIINLLKKLSVDKILRSLLSGDELTTLKNQLDIKEITIEKQMETLKLKDQLIAQKEQLLSDQKIYVDEKERLLKKIEEQLTQEKEAMVGKNNLDFKRDILMPSLKEKWEAEKKKIDAERGALVLATPKITLSIESMKLETQSIINLIRGKPRNSGNSDLLLKNQGKLEAIEDIILMIDKEKTSEK